MSNIRVERGAVCGLWHHQVTDLEYRRMLQRYRDVLLSVYGPCGGALLIRNQAGWDNWTASSKAIMGHAAFFHPTTKYISSLVSVQNEMFGCFGLYVGIVCSSLLFESIGLEDKVCHTAIQCTADWLASEILNEITTPNINLVSSVDFGSLTQLMDFTRGIFLSKRCNELSDREVDHVVTKTIEAFLKTVPDVDNQGFGQIHIKTDDGIDVLFSDVYDGILIRDVDIERNRVERFLLMHGSKQSLHILLFCTVLSSKMEESLDSRILKSKNFEEIAVWDIYETLKRVMKENDIHILANQKYVHPVVKFYLERDGFLVIERLGTLGCRSLSTASGAVPISTLSELQTNPSILPIGKLQSLEVVSIKDKEYLLLKSCNTTNITLHLCGKHSFEIDHLKEHADTSVGLLRMLVQDGRVLPGAGCTESWILTFIQKLATTKAASLAAMQEISVQNVLKVFSVFSKCFSKLVIPQKGDPSIRWEWVCDPRSGHVFKADSSGREHRCSCGSSVLDGPLPQGHSVHDISSVLSRHVAMSSNGGPGVQQDWLTSESKGVFSSRQILDHFGAKINALHLAFEGFGYLYAIGQVIFDR